MRPPEGVSCSTLEKINLCLEISRFDDLAPFSRAASISSTGWMSGLNSVGPEQDIDAVLCLIDAALRLSISNTPLKNLPDDIAIQEVVSFRRLEDICPVIFKPGYLPV